MDVILKGELLVQKMDEKGGILTISTFFAGAERFGIQRPSLSRELNKMRSERLIEFDAKTGL